MKPKALARIALKNIKKGVFIFDCPERKKEALRVINDVLRGTPDIKNDDLDDPIIEFHIGVYIPNFDYPIIPVDKNGIPIVWDEKQHDFKVPGKGTHVFRGVGISGEHYYMGYLKSLAPFVESEIKVDRYTNVDHAAHAFLCTMTRIIDKDWALDHMIDDYPLKIEYDVLLDHWQEFTKTEDVKVFEMKQKHLYIRWLQTWITKHRTNPDTHMRVLKNQYKKVTKVPAHNS